MTLGVLVLLMVAIGASIYCPGGTRYRQAIVDIKRRNIRTIHYQRRLLGRLPFLCQEVLAEGVAQMAVEESSLQMQSVYMEALVKMKEYEDGSELEVQTGDMRRIEVF